jgi:hypothetical protein
MAKYDITRNSVQISSSIWIHVSCSHGWQDGLVSSAYRWLFSPEETLPAACAILRGFVYVDLHKLIVSRVSSGSIVSDYGLDDRAIGVRSPAGAKEFTSNLCVQTGSGAHPASCTMVLGVFSPGVKARPGRDDDHSPPSSAAVVNE